MDGGIGPAIGGFAIFYSGFYYLFVFGLVSSGISLIMSLFLKEVKFGVIPNRRGKREQKI